MIWMMFIKKHWTIKSKQKNQRTDCFLYIIAGMLSNKRRNPVVTELFITGRKLNNYLAFLCNLILLYQKMLDWILHTFFIMKTAKQTRTKSNRI